MKSSSVTIQMKATEQHFPAVLFIMLYIVVLTFETVDEILRASPRISNPMENNFSVPCLEIMGTHL